MVKVCHMTSAHKSNDIRIFYKECTSLAKAGYDVYLVAPGESFELNGVNIVGVPFINGGRVKRMTHGAKAIYKAALGTNADIFHIHDPELLPYALKIKKMKKTVIFDSHEDFVESLLEKKYIPLLLRYFLFIYFRLYYYFTLRKLSAVITVSPHLGQKLGRLNKNTHIITNYPIVTDRNAKKEYSASNTIVYAGGISNQWCHETIIESLGKCKNARYVLMGSGEENYINKLKMLPQWEYVDFIGRVSHEEVYKKYSESSIGVAVLTYNRNTGNKTGTLGNTKIFEYMSEALPIVCTDFVLWKEIVEKHKCGICVNPYSSEEIANAIDYLLRNPESAEEMGQNGRQAVLETYNWDIEEKKLVALYSSILG